ncbi:MAG: DUF2232 domain-containing protein [Deltaproteobacteria bacterium]|nr:DUF2232 domain-containing protein [Deltaproteobacteria bacterium]
MTLSSKQVLPVLWCALLSTAFYFSGFFVLFTPLPVLYLSLRRNKLQWAISFALTLALVFSVSQLIFSEPVPLNAIYYLFIGSLLSLGVWKRWSLARWGAYVGLSATVAVILTGFICQYLGGYDVPGFLQRIVQESQTVLDQVTASQVAKGDKAEVVAMVEQMKKNLEFLPRLIPSLVFSFSLFVMIFNLSFLKVIYRLSKHLIKAGDFKRLEISSVCVWGVIVAAVCYFLDFYVFKVTWLTWVALNLILVAGMVYFIQGVSIMVFFLKRYSPLFRFGIYGLVVLFFQMVGLVVVGLGLADTWFDFRRLHQQKQTTDHGQ